MSENRIPELVDALTRAEKRSLVQGTWDPAGRGAGFLPGVERLDIPPLRLYDGPLGVRVHGERTTAFPASIAAAATFAPDLVRRQGAAMAREARALGGHVLLAPSLNVLRVPQSGRSFESFGEDPVLIGRCAAAAVRGIQSEDVIATPKHFVANNQETHRTTVSAEVSKRALREIYLTGFRETVRAGTRSIMAAYNQVNDTPMTAHGALLTELLRDEWGFSGYTVSDWWAVRDGAAAATAGTDVEMPGEAPDEPISPSDEVPPGMLAPFSTGMPEPPLEPQFGAVLENGAVPVERRNEMVRRVLTAMDAIGHLAGNRSTADPDWEAHAALAQEIAIRGTVLLKNDGVLPLPADADVAVLGPAVNETTVGGGGSAEVDPRQVTPTADGIDARAQGAVTVVEGVAPASMPSFFDLAAGADIPSPETAETNIEDAVAAAADADVAVVVCRDWRTEGCDLADLSLPGGQDDLVSAAAAANDRTVVVLQTGGPVEMPWRGDVAGILTTWYPGQADGDALAAVLYGDRDPAGRLPVTIAPADAYPTAEERAFPGVDGRAHYDEGVFVGYRHFTREGQSPTYPFGHGASYTSFAFEDVALEDAHTASVSLTNTGDRRGHTVAQAYVEPPEDTAVPRPSRELVGFTAVALDPGETTRVEISLDEQAYRYWSDGWQRASGVHTIAIARSSTDPGRTVAIER